MYLSGLTCARVALSGDPCVPEVESMPSHYVLLVGACLHAELLDVAEASNCSYLAQQRHKTYSSAGPLSHLYCALVTACRTKSIAVVCTEFAQHSHAVLQHATVSMLSWPLEVAVAFRIVRRLSVYSLKNLVRSASQHSADVALKPAAQKPAEYSRLYARTRHTVAHRLDVLPAEKSVIDVVLHYSVTCLMGLLALLVRLTSAAAN